MKIFTINRCQIEEGVDVVNYQLCTNTIEAVIIGGTLGYGKPVPIPVVRNGNTGYLYNAKYDGQKLVEELAEDDNDNKCIVILQTPYAYKGGNQHAGDILPNNDLGDFPGEVIARAITKNKTGAQFGQGENLVAIVNKGDIFSARVMGDKKMSYFYVFDGQEILAAKGGERRFLDKSHPLYVE